MRAAWIALAAVLLSADGTTKLVLNDVRVVAEPNYWSRRVADVKRGDRLTVVKMQGAWVKVSESHRGVNGYVPRSAFEDPAISVDFSAADAASVGHEDRHVTAERVADASRGLSSDAHAAEVQSAQQLQLAAAWVDRYESIDGGAGLMKALIQEPKFLASGHLTGGAP